MSETSVKQEKSRGSQIFNTIRLPLVIVFVLPVAVAIVLGEFTHWIYLKDQSFVDVLVGVVNGLRMVGRNSSQLLIISLLQGSIYCLAAVGLTMTYRILKFANFAHAELITFGAYVAYVLNVEWGGLSPGVSLILGSILAFIIGGMLGIGCDSAVYKRLRGKGAEAMSLMIASIGISYIIRHLIQQRYGSAPIYFRLPSFANEPHRIPGASITIFEASITIPGASITILNVVIIAAALIMVAILHILLTRTTLGKAMRATADNPVLAQAAGIHTERIIFVTWFVGAGVAAIGGCLRAADTELSPILGFRLLLLIFAVVILDGIGSFYGAVIAAYIIAAAENIGVLLLVMVGVSTVYRQAMAFIVLIVVLLVKPTGILGLKEPGVGEE